MMALAAANASTPATRSFGLCSRMRIARPRSASASTATARAPRRRRGMSSSLSSSLATRLGTFLHLMRLIWWSGSRRRRQRRDIAGWPRRRRRERQRQRHRDGGAFMELALYRDLAGMQGDQALDDRQAKTGAFVPPLIGLAGLEEGVADPLEIVGRDAHAGIGAAKNQPRSVDRGGSRHPTAALGELDGVGDEVQHDLLERARIAVHEGQV